MDFGKADMHRLPRSLAMTKISQKNYLNNNFYYLQNILKKAV